MTSSDFKNLEWLTSQELKYCDFVAYARKPPEGDPYYDSLNSEITKAIYDWKKKMEELYPEETQRICSADVGDFSPFSASELGHRSPRRCAGYLTVDLVVQ